MAVSTTYIQPRHKTLAFYGVPKTGMAAGDVTYRRMTKFTQLEQSKNPQEYSRKYVDEANQRTDVVGYAPAINYAFDKHRNIDVHDDIIKITNNEYIAETAIRTLIWVDTATGDAIQRDYSVIPNSEGGDSNVYTYSGTFKATGEAIHGRATSTDDWQTITFTDDSAQSLALDSSSAVKVSTSKAASK